MAKFLMAPTIHSEKVVTARLGGNASGTRANDNDVGKPVKLGGDSNYVLCASTNAIEGIITSVETGLYDGYVLGGVVTKGYARAIAGDTVTVGTYVVADTPDAIQTAKTYDHLVVVPASNQSTAATAAFKARVVSLDGGAGTVGLPIIIELL